MRINHIGVIGAGAWGTALAQAIATAGPKVSLWAREPEVAAQIAKTRENQRFLPGVRVAANISAVADLALLAEAQIEPTARAEEIPVEGFVTLARIFFAQTKNRV